MKIRTFWMLLFKIMGTWLFLESLPQIPQLYSALMPILGNNNINDLSDVIFAIILVLFSIGAYLLIIKLLIFNPTWIIDKLKLDKGFQEDIINLNINPKNLLTIATILIGGIIF